MNIVHEVICFDEIFGDVAQFDADILGLVHRCLELDIFKVKNKKLGAFTGKDAVEQELDEVDGSVLGSDGARISDVMACDSDASAIGIRLLGAKNTNNL